MSKCDSNIDMGLPPPPQVDEMCLWWFDVPVVWIFHHKHKSRGCVGLTVVLVVWMFQHKRMRLCWGVYALSPLAHHAIICIIFVGLPSQTHYAFLLIVMWCTSPFEMLQLFPSNKIHIRVPSPTHPKKWSKLCHPFSYCLYKWQRWVVNKYDFCY